MRTTSLLGTLMCGALAVGLTACGGEDIETIGTYESNFGATEVITATDWNGDAIADYDNSANWVVTQSPADAEFNPNLYNRLEWTEPAEDGSFYYCFVVFGQDTAEMARTSTLTADSSDPDTSGCGGFSWTKLTPQ